MDLGTEMSSSSFLDPKIVMDGEALRLASRRHPRAAEAQRKRPETVSGRQESKGPGSIGKV